MAELSEEPSALFDEDFDADEPRDETSGSEQEQNGEHGELSEELRANQPDVCLPVHVIRGVLAGVLSDASFAIATDETKTCLRIAQELIKYFHQPSIECERFALWLMSVLDEVIMKSKKRTGMINQDKLWSKYHQLTTSEAFNGKWINFWGS